MLSNYNINFSPYHEYVSMAICMVGVFCNTITIIIFTRPVMRTPINTILCVGSNRIALLVAALCIKSSSIVHRNV